MEEVKKIAIGSDHAGYAVKEELKRHLKDKGWEVRDFGVNSAYAADYPDTGKPLAEAVASGEFSKGILLCGTGHGMSYTANRVPGVRAALCWNSEYARLSREHNDANILVMPGRSPIEDPHIDIVDAWLSTKFSGDERHLRRINKIDGKVSMSARITRRMEAGTRRLEAENPESRRWNSPDNPGTRRWESLDNK